MDMATSRAPNPQSRPDQCVGASKEEAAGIERRLRRRTDPLDDTFRHKVVRMNIQANKKEKRLLLLLSTPSYDLENNRVTKQDFDFHELTEEQ